ncbi:MAG: CDP-diacylglycerol O-phosphatidyltransferase [Saprospiraceae bacterium]|nr:CDP-diacylglycerol O-phosphatidyltransferase [Saprospiraceae bacterium]
MLPNALTLLNLFCGCCALVSIFSMDFRSAILCVAASAVLDFADGMAARLLKVHSEIGKQLDSLADMVSFGVVPSAVVYMLLAARADVNIYNDSVFMSRVNIAGLPAFLIAVASCYRLAKFNLDTRQTTNFIGLATPANTLFFVGLLLILLNNAPFGGWERILFEPIVLYVLTVIFSFLLISEIPMFSLKIKNFEWKGNENRYIFLVLSLILLLILRGAASFFYYDCLCLINVFGYLLGRKKTA